LLTEKSLNFPESGCFGLLQLLPDFYRSSLKIHVLPSESSRFLGSTALTGSVDNVFRLARTDLIVIANFVEERVR
jgi:hypothetical protein